MFELNVYGHQGQGSPLGAPSDVKFCAVPPTEQTIARMAEQGLRGLFYSTWYLDDAARQAAKLTREAGMEFVLSMRYHPETNDGLVAEAKKLTGKFAWGNDGWGEFNPFGDSRFGSPYYFDVELAEWHLREAKRLNYEWACPLVHTALLWDLSHGQKLRAALGQTQVFCLGAHRFMGYLYADPTMRIDFDAELDGHNLYQEYGLSVEALREYLAPMNVWTGAGFQQGLNAGSRIYAARLGFKGVVAGIPFSLEGTDAVAVRDKPDKYPERMGEYD